MITGTLKAVYHGKVLAEKPIGIGPGYSELSIDIPFSVLPEKIVWEEVTLEVWNIVLQHGEFLDINGKWTVDLPDGGKKAVVKAMYMPSSPSGAPAKPPGPSKLKQLMDASKAASKKPRKVKFI